MESPTDLPPIRQSAFLSSEFEGDVTSKTEWKVLGTLARYARHLSALLVVIAGITISQVEWPFRPALQPGALPQTRPSRALVSSRGGSRMTSDGLLTLSGSVRTEFAEHDTPTPVAPAASPSPTEALPVEIAPSAEPSAEVAPPLVRTEIITYEVQAGDIVGTIARQFGISENTLCWANGRLADNPDYLRVGQHLYILPIDGVMHIVDKGDTLESIAKLYNAKAEDIIAYEGNGLVESAILVEEQPLIVPGGRKPYVPKTVVAWKGTPPKGVSKGSGSFVWPTTGVLTGKYWAKHLAIDIGWSEGTSVIASDSGYVAQVGYSPDGYGRLVIIDHGNGYQTLYAHLKVFFVAEGQSVGKGEKIGHMGNTGRSTGPHLHFEIRKNGVKVNPLSYLP